MIYEIPFTQYILPNGKRKQIVFNTKDETVKNKSDDLIKKDYRFEIEILRTGQISATIHNIKSGCDVAICVVSNDMGLTASINKMILEFDPSKDDSIEYM